MESRWTQYLHRLASETMQVVRLYPVELLFALAGCIGGICGYESGRVSMQTLVALVPLLFVLSLVLKHALGRRNVVGRVSSLVLLALLFVLPWCNAVQGWVQSTAYVISLLILTPLLLLIGRRARSNEEFVSDAMVWSCAGATAFFFANTVLLLFYALFYSTIYIFAWQGKWVETVAVWSCIVCESFVVPLLFLIFSDRWLKVGWRARRLFSSLLVYAVVPAVLLYAVMLYLYLARIVLLWSLPKGGVAYLIFGFTMTALVVKAWLPLTGRHLYDWFFSRFSLISLPLSVLFWIGVARRIGEYGFTESRVYLVACGLLMTGTLLLFLSQRFGRYLWVAVAAFSVFAALAYIPFLEPERIAVRSQVHRVEQVAERLGCLGRNGRLQFAPLSLADTVYKKEYRKLYESLDYIRSDSAAFARFGMENLNDFVAIFPEGMRDYVKQGYDSNTLYCTNTRIIELDAPVNARFEVDAEYPHYYTNLRDWKNDSYKFDNDTLRLFLGEERAIYQIPCRNLLECQLEKSGFDPVEESEPTRGQLLRLLDYRDDRCRILFGNLKLECTDSVVVVQGMSIHAVLMR